MTGRVKYLFTPHEIKMLICGNSVLDFKDLQEITEYEGYTA